MKVPIFFLFLLLNLLLSISSARGDVRDSAQQVKSWSIDEKWSKDRQWQKLMHFEVTLLGSFESQVDGDDFFFSPEGKKNLKAELEATLAAFFSADPGDLKKEEKFHPICRFPARWSWIQKKIANRKLEIPHVDCPRFEKFKKALQGPNASLVFSSYYLNNPSSAFGHTFLRINKMPDEKGQRYELLDYGLNYAANRDTDNGAVFAFNGLFGLLSGSFTATPYYYKVREYSNAESRDLWEYELNLNSETVTHMIEHVWELGATRINYWYLSENCSYHMFSILEAADPQIDLLSKLKKFVIPSDTVQVLFQVPGLVKSVHFRPSIRTELLTRARDLSADEMKLVLALIRSHKIPENLSSFLPVSQARILDTAIDYVDFKYAYDVQVAGSEMLKLKSFILAQRSRLDVISDNIKVDEPPLERPHLAHGSRRWGAGFLSNSETANRYLLDYKFALHDQLDPIQGYPEYAQITFFNFQASVEDVSRKLALEEWTLFEVLSTLPFSNLQNDLSWRFRVSTERVRNENCDFCRWSGVSGGAGGSWSLLEAPYAFIYFGIRGVSGLTSNEKWLLWTGFGPEARLRIRWTPHLITLVEAFQRLDLQGAQRIYFERGISTQYSFSELTGLRGRYTDYGFDKVGSLELFKYY